MTKSEPGPLRNLLRASCDDLQRPLGSLRASTETLGASKDLSVRDRELVRITAEHVQRAETSLRSALDLAVERAGVSLPLQRTRCNLDEVSIEALECVMTLRAQRGFRYTPSGASAELDEARTLQLLLALLEHADELAREGGHIDLSWCAAERSVVAEVRVEVCEAISAVAPPAPLPVPLAIARAHGGDLVCVHERPGSIVIRASMGRRVSEGVRSSL